MATKDEEKNSLRPLWPSAAVMVLYRRWMQKAIKMMSDDTTETVLAAPLAPLRDIPRLTIKWVSYFDLHAPEVAALFTRGQFTHLDNAFRRELMYKAGWAVEFRPTPASIHAYESVMAENVALIKSIPEKYYAGLSKKIFASVQGGFDEKALADDLVRSYGITFRRAALIAKDQSAKAKAVIEQARRLELGMTEAIWFHSHAGKEPRPRHVAAGREKLVFNIAEGAPVGDDDGNYVIPGEEINCRCSSRAILPKRD